MTNKRFSRKLNERVTRKKFLIVCEGKTEENYFSKFRINKKVVAAPKSKNSPGGIVELAKKLQEEDDYDQVWCVFEFLNTAISRSNYLKKLNSFLPQKYQKNFPGMYDLLLSN